MSGVLLPSLIIDNGNILYISLQTTQKQEERILDVFTMNVNRFENINMFLIGHFTAYSCMVISSGKCTLFYASIQNSKFIIKK